MSGDGDKPDRPSWTERDKLSFSELDRRRRDHSSSGESAPRGPGGQARDGEATRQYIKQLDGLFSTAQGGAEGGRLAQAMRDAHGTPVLAEACRAYRDAVGMPADPGELSLFLDCGDPELVLAGLEAFRAVHEAGALEATRGLKSQLRILAQDPDDAVAEAAEELVEIV